MQGLSSEGCPEAGQKQMKTFGSALIPYCFNGYLQTAEVLLVVTGQGCCTCLALLEGLKAWGKPYA